MGTRRIVTLIFCFIFACLVHAQSTFIDVEAGVYSRLGTLVEVQVKTPLQKGKEYQVKNVVTGKTSPVQNASGSTVMFILPDALVRGQRAKYKLEKFTAKNTKSVKIIEQNGGLQFLVGSKTVLFYSTELVNPPDGNPDYYSRSGFIHPLYSPSGNILTDDFPIGHVHQHGIMMAWVNTTYKNTSPDFWNQHLKKGNVRHVSVLSVEEGPVFSRAQLKLEHYTPQGEVVLNEKWTITVYAFSDYFLYDIRSDQTNVTNDTLFLNKYHYGGMSFRGNRQWNSDDTLHFKNRWKVLTDAGYGIVDGNGKTAAYVSVEGLVDDCLSGVTVFGFPDNFRYPQSIRIHPTMPYWCYAPIVDASFSITPNQTYSSRYRYYVHDNTVNNKIVKQLHQDLIDPPVVRLIN